MNRNAITFSIIFCLISLYSFAQWEWQNPLPQGNNLNDTHFFNNQTGWAVGNYGTILHTDNGGVNWEIRSSGTKNNLNSLSFVGDNEAWIAGDNGLILYSNNGGSDWIEQNSGTEHNLRDCSFINENFGWAVGDSGLILHTENGGDNWDIQNSPTELALYSICFIDSLNGWICGADIYHGNSIILHTNDGGISWLVQNTSSLEGWYNPLFSICFTDSLNGWAVGGYITESFPEFSMVLMLHTTDGGINWEWQQDILSLGTLYSVYFNDSQNGWAVGGPEMLLPHDDYGMIIYTNDGGENWVVPYDDDYYEKTLYAFCFVDDENGIFVGANGIILTSNDGGNSLIEQSVAITRKGLRDVSFTDTNTGWTVGSEYESSFGSKGIILKTDNGGTDWVDTAPDTMLSLNSVHCNGENVWVAGGYYVQFGTQELGYIYFSEDDGNTWSQQYFNNIGNINSIFFTDNQHGWAAGGEDANSNYSYSGIVLHTSNGGNEWNLQFSDTSNLFHSTYFINNDIGWTVGTNGTIYSTDNTGLTWEIQESGTNVDLYEVIFTSTENGWIIGSNYSSDIILHTTNGGDTWEESISGEGWGLRDIHFSNMLNGWAVGNHIVLYTNNGGNNWIVYEDIPKNHLSSVWFTDPDNGWIVGSSGTILNIGNGSTVDLEEIMGTFSNLITAYVYPNPFSTSTAFEYDLPQSSTVQITFFNHLGTQVDQIQQNQSQGKQQVTWNAKSQPAGIYYFRLEAGDQTASGKVVLVR